MGSTGLEDRPGNGHVCSAPPQLVVIDLRSYAVTLGNRAKGGGSECVGEELLVLFLRSFSPLDNIS